MGGGNRSIKESTRITTLSFGGKSGFIGVHSLSIKFGHYSRKKADFAADGSEVLLGSEGFIGASITFRGTITVVIRRCVQDDRVGTFN
jgi:hypothetical protein